MTVNAATMNAMAMLGGLTPLTTAGWTRMASGILAQAVNQLMAGPFAQSMLPPTVGLSCGPCGAPPVASWNASTTGAHTASVDLGDGYSLRIDERNSEMTILNAATGETTRIWGDPHVDVDGKHAFDFWGTTSFQLENGTKITINTEQWAGNPNMYVASQVVVTRGANAVVVDGISQNRLGDLSVGVSTNGHALDAAHRDGFMLYENATGSGWRAEHGAVATQRDLDVTRPGEAYGPGAEAPSLSEFWGVLSNFLFTGRLPVIEADRAERAPIRSFARMV